LEIFPIIYWPGRLKRGLFDRSYLLSDFDRRVLHLFFQDDGVEEEEPLLDNAHHSVTFQNNRAAIRGQIRRNSR